MLNLHFPTLLFIAGCMSTKIDKPIHAENSFWEALHGKPANLFGLPMELEKRSEP
jgi:hypothetical protein